MQAQIPAAMCALHNFIRLHNPLDDEDSKDDLEKGSKNKNGRPRPDDDEDLLAINFNEGNNAKAWRHGIADMMWADYQ